MRKLLFLFLTIFGCNTPVILRETEPNDLCTYAESVVMSGPLEIQGETSQGDIDLFLVHVSGPVFVSWEGLGDGALVLYTWDETELLGEGAGDSGEISLEDPPENVLVYLGSSNEAPQTYRVNLNPL